MRILIELDLETNFTKEEREDPETQRAIQEGVYSYLSELIDDESLDFKVVEEEE